MIAAAHPLAHVNAVLNATAGLLLIIGYVHIRRGREETHRRTMLAVVCVSALFLASYVAHHAAVGSVRFTGTGAVRAVYFAILVTHIILAAAVMPLVVLVVVWGNQATGRRALGGRPRNAEPPQNRERMTRLRTRHRLLARWTLPIWLYVSATGVAVYLMLYHIFPPAVGSGTL
jgi:uncharacterized membrane protein YozB (DUF420 family)